jgi:hypothetical protein
MSETFDHTSSEDDRAFGSETLDRIGHEYRQGADRPLGGYVATLVAYGSAIAVLGGVTVRRRRLGRRIPPGDLAQIAVATYKLSRLIAKAPVTSPLRAPFTSYQDLSGPSELAEEVRGHGIAHSIGELLTCPFCLAQWIATGFVFGHANAPRATRTAASILTIAAASDLLQHLHSEVIGDD